MVGYIITRCLIPMRLTLGFRSFAVILLHLTERLTLTAHEYHLARKRSPGE
jgi:hypothetical protein